MQLHYPLTGCPDLGSVQNVGDNSKANIIPQVGCRHTYRRSQTRSSCPGRSSIHPDASSPCSRRTPSCSRTLRPGPSLCWTCETGGPPDGVSETSAPPSSENWGHMSRNVCQLQLWWIVVFERLRCCTAHLSESSWNVSLPPNVVEQQSLKWLKSSGCVCSPGRNRTTKASQCNNPVTKTLEQQTDLSSWADCKL